MDIDQTQLQMLGQMIEKIVFNPIELEELKSLITAVSSQKIPPRKLKERIIELRGCMMDSIVKLFPFYNKSLSNNKEIESFGNNNNSELTKELEEKNNILEQIGTKLQELEVRLQKDFIE